MCGGAGGMWELCVLFAQFCSECNTALKKEILFFIKRGKAILCKVKMDWDGLSSMLFEYCEIRN